MKTTIHRPSGLSWTGLALRRAMFLITFCCAFTLAASAQNDDEEWEDEEEETPTEEKALIDDRPSKKEDVTIQLNGAPFQWKEEIHIQREDTLDISVRDLAPGSRVEIVAEKGGINLSKKVFYSNAKGELDLEVRIGNKKIKGKANLIYTPSNGVKRQKEIDIIVE